MIETVGVVSGGDWGCKAHRIPSLIVASDGSLLAFWEGRRDGPSDTGEIAVLMRRSRDGGRSWSDAQIVVSSPGMTCGNPCPVVDRETGRIVMMITKNAADAHESEIKSGEKPPRTAWVTVSEDHGASWSEPSDVSSQVKREDWAWFASGPGHAIQLAGGRIVMPCDHVISTKVDAPLRVRSHLALSDDGGVTWRIGAIMPVVSNECCALETPGGEVYLNCRTRKDPGVRAWGRSRDGGETFHDVGHHPELCEPTRYAGGCQGSLLALREDLWLFCNPASGGEERRNLSVRVSRDHGLTWSAGRTVHAGPSAYSDLALLNDGAVGCLFECGEAEYNERIDFARIDPKWLDAEQAG